jgi:hypothetical protein
MDGACGTYGGRGEVHIGLWRGKLRVEGKRPLAKPRRRWENNIETDQEIGCGDTEWIHLAQVWDRWRATVNAEINLRGPIKCEEFLDYVWTCWLLKKDSGPLR